MIDGWLGQVGSESQTVALGRGHADQLERLPDGAGAAGRGRGRDPVGRHGIVKDQPGHRRVEGGLSREAGIGLGRLGFPKPPLGGLDCAHDGRQAGRILVDADAEVDLGIARVIAEHLDQGKDLVLRLRLQGLEHGLSFRDAKIVIHAPFGP